MFRVLSGQPARYKSTPVDEHIALGGGVLLMVAGLFFVARAVIGKLRSRD
jgi:hypothetical protein